MSQLIQARYQSAAEEEEVRVAKVLTWLSLMAVLFLVGFGVKSYSAGNLTHTYAQWIFAGVLGLNLLIHWRTGNRKLFKGAILVIVALLFGYLVSSGGESNTGPLWLYVFPPLLFYVTSLKAGSAMIVGFLVYSVVVFQFPGLPFVTTEYDSDFKLRFFSTIMFESVFCFTLDASRRKTRNELMDLALMHEQAARTDELTRLSNRRDMQQRLTMEFARYQRSGHYFSIVLVDLDLFKGINDNFGHNAGDAVLRQFSRILRNVVRTTDLAARWGGEEFLILLPDTSLLQALTLAERLREEVAQTQFIFEDERLSVTISAGVSSVTQSDSINHLLRQVDMNLYDAKQGGRNRIAPAVCRKASQADGIKPEGT